MTWSVVVLGATVFLLASCSNAPRYSAPLTVQDAALNQYRTEVAHRIEARNSASVLHGSLQAMLRSVVVISFTVDRNGYVVASAVYRTNGDPEAERIALATIRRATPLPPPPSQLLNRRGQVEMMEDWMFNDNGHFELGTFAKAEDQDQ